MKTTIGTMAAMAIAASVSLAGCGGSECEKIYDKLKQCEKEEFAKVPKAEFVKMCEEQKKKSPQEFKEETVCMSKGSCEDYKKCEEDRRAKRDLDRLMKKIEEAKASKKWDDAVSECKYEKELLAANADAQKACAEVMAAAMGDMFKAVEGKRDAGERAIGECMDLKDMAATLGGDHPAKVETLCAETDAAERVAEALKEAKANVDAKKADIPVSCSLALKDLEKVTSDWGKQKTAEVAKACYLDLGNVIMEAKVPGMKYTCDYYVGEVYKAVKQYELKDATMDAHMAKAAKLCEKEAAK